MLLRENQTLICLDTLSSAATKGFSSDTTLLLISLAYITLHFFVQISFFCIDFSKIPSPPYPAAHQQPPIHACLSWRASVANQCKEMSFPPRRFFVRFRVVIVFVFVFVYL